MAVRNSWTIQDSDFQTAPMPEAHEHGLGHVAAPFAGDQDVGAGGAFRVGQHAVLLDDQRAPQRHHHQHAEHAAGEGAAA